eukprot:TRINITY_DN1425_c0_g1_i1.p1 TRINITY_DN1425_c0_g1~~TRINITY_DN1425_c0_g1_i1.p1  ORF type:complete len:292 (-),score=54.34 TRINITY_DN1425_c0_g1_i1:116-991(-)
MTIRSEGLFGVGLFLMGACIASSSYAIVAVVSLLPALILFQFCMIGDLAVSIMAIAASKKYGPKTLISSTVLSGINTLLRAAAFTLLLFYLFGAPLQYLSANRTKMPNEDETRTQYNLPSDEFPTFAPGAERPPRPHGPGGPGECPSLPADLPPFPGDLPPLPGRPGHCGPGFPGRPGHPGHPGGHEGQDPREQEPGQGEDDPRRGGENVDPRESDNQQTTRQSRARPAISHIGTSAPYIAWGISLWSLGLNIAIFALSITHTRRAMSQAKSSANTTTVNGKVYSELSSKV